MRSHQSIQIPLRLDRNRKALMTQLSANITKTATATPKRNQAQQYDQWQDLQTLKKKQHIDLNAMTKKQNEKILKQNDRFTSTQKQTPLKSKTNRKQDPFDPKHQPLKPTDLNLMLDHRLFNLGQFSIDDSKLFSEKERLLISIQEKLDSHLIFLKEHRKKKKGELFSIIKKTFLENYRIFLEFSHIKKILFISENLYVIQKFGDVMAFDCIVDIKLSCKESDQKALENELKQRKDEFRSKLFAYKENFDQNITSKKQFQIPQVKFQFEQVLESKKTTLKASMNKLFDGQLIKKKKLDRFFMLQNKNSAAYEQSKKTLQKGMKKVQSIIRKQKQLDLSMLSNKIFEKRMLSQREIKGIIHEISVIFRDRGVLNMLECELVEGLSKKMIMTEGIISRVVGIFLQVSTKMSNKGSNSNNNRQPQHQQRQFLTLINHKLGRLIKIDNSSMRQFQTFLTQSKQWMGRFEFEIQMNGDYIKAKMQQQRDRFYQSLQKQEKLKCQQSKTIDSVKVTRCHQMNENNNNRELLLKQMGLIIDQQQSKIQSQQQQQKQHYKIRVINSLSNNSKRIDQKQRDTLNKDDHNNNSIVEQDNKEQCMLLAASNNLLNKEQFKSTLSNSQQLIYQQQQSQNNNNINLPSQQHNIEC